MTVENVIKRLEAIADPEKVLLKQRKYNIVAENAMGVYHQDLKVLAKEIGPDEDLAIALFDSGVYEGRLLCSKLFRPKYLTADLMEKWVKTFENWEITDSFCMGLFAPSQFALEKIRSWTKRSAEFEKRSGYVIMAAYGFKYKKDPNSVFESFFPIIEEAATDNRIYVKKAANWALRNIGKRNADLRHSAIETANSILKIEHPAAQWIAKDALRELQKPDLKLQDYPRSIYRK